MAPSACPHVGRSADPKAHAHACITVARCLRARSRDKASSNSSRKCRLTPRSKSMSSEPRACRRNMVRECSLTSTCGPTIPDRPQIDPGWTAYRPLADPRSTTTPVRSHLDARPTPDRPRLAAKSPRPESAPSRPQIDPRSTPDRPGM